MKNRVILGTTLAFMLTSALPQSADAFTGKRSTRIAQVNETVFEVVARGKGGGADYWCGAADYARRALGAGWKTPIYIARGLGPSVTTGRRSAIQFTLDPDAAGITPVTHWLSLNTLKVGENMTVQDGNFLCIQSPGQF